MTYQRLNYFFIGIILFITVINVVFAGSDNAKWTAKQILSAYQTKNWKNLSIYTRGFNKTLMSDLINGKKSPRLRSITSGWRWREVSNWNGKIIEVRYRSKLNPVLDKNQKTAYAKFSQRGDSCYIVTMLMHNNQWYFEDINSPNCKRFNSYDIKQ